MPSEARVLVTFPTLSGESVVVVVWEMANSIHVKFSAIARAPAAPMHVKPPDCHTP